MRPFRLCSALSLLLAFSALSFAGAKADAQPGAPAVSQGGAQPRPAQRNRISAAAGGEGRLTAISGHRPAWANPANDAGAVPRDRTLRLTFALTRAPELQAAFKQLLTDQQTPGSPCFHHWLTPTEMGTQFGPTEHDVDAFTGWLRAQGFQIEAIYPSRVFVQVTAPAEVAGAALHTEIHTYRVGGTTVSAPTAEPSLPASLAPFVEAIGGLAGVPFVHDLHKTVGSARLPEGTARLSAAHPDLTVSDPQNNLYYYLTPGDFATIYDVAPAYASGINGAGQTIAILGGSRLAPADVSRYEAATGLTTYQPTYVVPKGLADPGTTGLLPNATADDAGNEEEAQLDFNRAYGTAPGARIEMVVAQDWLSNTTDNLTPMFQFVANQNPVPAVMSVSIGGCEAGSNAAANDHVYDALFSQFAGEGISVFFSSGDAGASGCEIHDAPPVSTLDILAINQFCATGYVTCVGGTEFADTASPATYWNTKNSKTLVSALGYIPEGAWNEPITLDSTGAVVYVVTGTGGGPSTVIPKPLWQSGVGVPADKYRDTPDISFSASSHNGYFACLSFNDPGAPAGTTPPNCVPDAQGSFPFVIFSGTSASAPSMAGVAALAAQKLGGNQGNLNPLLYATAASSPAAFHDATPASSGVANCDVTVPSMCNNSTPGASGLTGGLAGYPLTAGYDLATGLGSLDVNLFLQAIVPGANGLTPSLTLTADVPSLTLTAGSGTGNIATLTFTSINLFTGTVNTTCVVTALSGETSAPGCTVTPGTATLSRGTTETSTLIIATTASAATTGHSLGTTSAVDRWQFGGLPGGRSFDRNTWLGGTATFASLLCLLLPRRRARAQRWQALGCVMLLAGSFGALSGCSSSGSFNAHSPTTKGNYMITVTASGTSKGETTAATTTLAIPLTVQ